MHSNHDKSTNLQARATAEHRALLTAKLSAMIAVLEAAIGNIDKNLQVPGCNETRLRQVRHDLGATLANCRRSKLVLDQAAAASRPVTPPRADRAPIARSEIAAVDFEELARRIAGMG